MNHSCQTFLVYYCSYNTVIKCGLCRRAASTAKFAYDSIVGDLE
jgi:hypothetical protein